MNGDLLNQSSKRVETLLDRFSAFPPATGARADAEELVRVVAALYGECLQRITTELSAEQLEQLCADPLVASLLITHGLHPVPLEERVRRALESIQSELAENNAGVQLVSVDEDAVTVRIDGMDGVVPVIERAIHQAAPEVLEVRAIGQTISLLSAR